ncbi:MAG: lysylphosphatidylglycerol synthetase family protein [Segetibacter sp.]|jgi:phosphatidylglycerol lysyltransferase|nr:lysylphosphatidylglycerol synthetase family protein [Segetibacter sp.]
MPETTASNRIKAFVSKAGWKEFLAIIFIIVACYFFWKQRGELRSLGTSLLNTDRVWLWIGIAGTVIYILLQAALYVYSFLAIGGRITWLNATELYLKRNVIAVFLPAGGITALAYLPANIRESQKNTQQVHHASVIYGFIGIFSVFIVAVPVLLYLWIKDAAVPGMGAAFFTVLAVLILMVLFIRSIKFKGPFYRFIIKGRPKVEKFLINTFSFDLSLKQFLRATFVSVLIEVIGIVHLYISMLGSGVDPSWEASIIGYIVAAIFLIISPFLRGMGAIELSLTFILQKYNYPTVAAVQSMLLFRFYEFWLPLLIGLLIYASKGRHLFTRSKPKKTGELEV